MPGKKMEFGTVGTGAANQITWRGILDDRNIGPGDATTLHVEVERPLTSASFAAAAPGLQVWINLLPVTVPAPSITPGPFALVGQDAGNQFAAGETRNIDFQITNDPAGGDPAAYTLTVWIQWNDGTGATPWFAGPAAGFVVP